MQIQWQTAVRSMSMQLIRKHTGADSMGTMGAIAPTAKKCGGDVPSRPHRKFVDLMGELTAFS